MSNGMKETASITTFKKWSFASDLKIETKDRNVLSALCKYCSKVECNDCIREDSALKSICFFQESVTYIHRSTFARHVGLQSVKHVICAKPPFLHSLDDPFKMFTNSLDVLYKQTPRSTDHVHWFKTQLVEILWLLVLSRQKTRLLFLFL